MSVASHSDQAQSQANNADQECSNNEIDSRAFRRWLLLLALLALLLRLINVRFVTGAFGQAQILDAAYYNDVALATAQGRSFMGLEDAIPFANRGYSQVLRCIYVICASPTVVLCLQALLGTLCVWLIGITAKNLFGRRKVGLWAAALLACYAPAIFYDSQLLTPSLSMFFTALLAWALERSLRQRSWPSALIAGFAIGASALLRASQLLLLPLVLAVLFRLRSRTGSGVNWRRQVIVLLLATSACVVPALNHHGGGAHAWVPITTNGGMNFWIGNHHGAGGTYEHAPFLGSSQGGDFRHTILIERDRFLAEAIRRAGTPRFSLAEASGFWFAQGLHEIAEAPLSWLALLGKKLLLTFNNYEARTNASFDLHQEISPILGHNPIRFGALFALGVFGLVKLKRHSHVHTQWLLGSLALAPLLTCVIFFVGGEYRHPACVPLIILGGSALSSLERTVRRREKLGIGSTWLRAGIVMVPAMLLSLLPVQRIGPARDRKAYAEALAMPDADGSLPTLERYALARQLLERRGESLTDRVYSSEALLLVESNQAIQFRDHTAAIRLLEAAKALWRQDLCPGAALSDSDVERIRRNLERRIAQLGRQSFVTQWDDVKEPLALLGSHGWREAESLIEQNQLQEADTFLKRANEMAPRSVQVMAYRGELEWRRNGDGESWIQRSLAGHPKLALPAIIAAERALSVSDLSTASRYTQIAFLREPGNRKVQQLISQLGRARDAH